MANIFVDTSALAKRYTNEVGSQWIRTTLRSTSENLVIISELALVELFSVLARREHDGDIKASSTARLRNIFLAHVRDEYSPIRIDGVLIARAQDLVTKHVALGLRSLDAIQLACAQRAQTALQQPVIFISADAKLLNAAAAEGFTTDDPNHHP